MQFFENNSLSPMNCKCAVALCCLHFNLSNVFHFSTRLRITDAITFHLISFLYIYLYIYISFSFFPYIFIIAIILASKFSIIRVAVTRTFADVSLAVRRDEASELKINLKRTLAANEFLTLNFSPGSLQSPASFNCSRFAIREARNKSIWTP